VNSPAAPGHVQAALNSDQSESNAADKQKVNPADPSPAPSVPSISHGGESGDTTLSMLSQPLPMIVSSDNADNPPVLDCVQEPAKSSTDAFDPDAVSEDTSHRKPTVSAATKSILHGMEESSSTYPALKPVARCLCAILDKYEVQSPSSYIQSETLTTAPANGGE
jgi:hypothetical protein